MKVYRSVHQYHSGLAPGDAITQQMFEIKGHLEKLGYESEIFGAHIDPDIRGKVQPIHGYRGHDSDLLIIHHSMGADTFDDVIGLPNDIITVYHNITPEEYFEDDVAKSYVRLGQEQLAALARRSRFGVGDSNFNRREMLGLGFRRVEVLPVKTDFASFSELRRWDTWEPQDWLFVGRIVGNKCQHKLVAAFAEYTHRFDETARLVLIGDTSQVSYVNRVQQAAEQWGVEDRVILRGKVSEGELHAAFAQAGFYVSLSEHEGFGVPILEAMAAGVPVVALSSTAVPETMGGAGILLRDGSPSLVSGAVQAIREDGQVRARLIDRQYRRITQVESFDVRTFLETCIRRAAGEQPSLEVQVQGPFETSYSLAILNRELAMGLADTPECRSSIYATEGPGDYEPSQSDLARVPDAAQLFRRAADVPYPHVAIRQMYPPRVVDSPASITCQYFGWEETSIPAEIASDFNSYLDGIGAMSGFVRDLLRNSGVSVPIEVVGVGVRPPDLTEANDPPEIAGLPSFRFLNIGSAFPRKAVDLLLRAYFAEFNGDDHVALILKTFPNPHNEVGSLLESLQRSHANPPTVCWINRDLSEQEIAGLYRAADWYVHPARAEGFGLPVAEAMAARVPVISVQHSGLADFVSEETSALVPFRLAPSDSHLAVPGSTWAEPDQAVLQVLMRDASRGAEDERVQARVNRAEELIRKEFSWSVVTDRWVKFLEMLELLAERPSVAMVSTWNTRCGIAENTRQIVDRAGDHLDIEILADEAEEVLDESLERDVQRVWVDRWKPDLSLLDEAVLLSDPDIVHVQFNFGFFELFSLAAFLRSQSARRATVISLHRTRDIEINGSMVGLGQIADDLRAVDRVIVHQISDAEELRGIGVVDNVRVVPLGVAEHVRFPARDLRKELGISSTPVLATFGFLLPHKGTLELLQAVETLKQECPGIVLLALCAKHSDPSSAAFEEEVRSEIRTRGLTANVSLLTEYLSDGVASTLLQAADAIVLPYRQTEESSSAALRFVLPLGRPIIATDLSIFADAREALFTVDPGSVTDLTSKIRQVLCNTALQEELSSRVEIVSQRFKWEHIVQRHQEVYAEARAAFRLRTGTKQPR